MGIPTVEALRHPVFRGHQYKRIKKFKKEKQAHAYADNLPKKSRRLPPIVEQVKIGAGLGYWYYVCVPKKLDKVK
jgi:hypothetical protein